MTVSKKLLENVNNLRPNFVTDFSFLPIRRNRLVIKLRFVQISSYNKWFMLTKSLPNIEIHRRVISAVVSVYSKWLTCTIVVLLFDD